MYDTYIIRSITNGKYYIGSGKSWKSRIKRHNSGYTRSLKNKGPFVLAYLEQFRTKAEAYKREKQIKRYKGGNAFKKLIDKK